MQGLRDPAQGLVLRLQPKAEAPFQPAQYNPMWHPCMVALAMPCSKNPTLPKHQVLHRIRSQP